jgi:hypothetical protein
MYNRFPEDEPSEVETCRRYKLKYYIRKDAFCWFILYNYITMSGAKHIKLMFILYNYITMHGAKHIKLMFILYNCITMHGAKHIKLMFIIIHYI